MPVQQYIQSCCKRLVEVGILPRKAIALAGTAEQHKERAKKTNAACRHGRLSKAARRAQELENIDPVRVVQRILVIRCVRSKY